MQHDRSGALAAFIAFFLWGVLPIFWKHLEFLPAATIVAHRTIWSLLLLSIILLIKREVDVIRRGFGSARMIAWHLLSGGLLAGNWLLYVWATINDRMIEGALGYYLNPFFNMLFGFLWFGERHNRTQMAAIGLALCGVAMQVPAVDSFPWVAITLAISFALYGVVKKRSPVDSRAGLTLETTLLAPLALAWLWFQFPSVGQAMGGSWQTALLLMATGLATTLPLICFGHAARHISLTTLGIFQFIGPTIQFFIGWRMYGEPMTGARLLSFSLIWAAIGLYAADAIRRERKSQHMIADPTL